MYITNNNHTSWFESLHSFLNFPLSFTIITFTFRDPSINFSVDCFYIFWLQKLFLGAFHEQGNNVKLVTVLCFLINGVGFDWVHLSRRTIVGLSYQPETIDKCGAFSEIIIGRGNRSNQTKSAPVFVCPPQIPPVLTWNRARTAAVGTQQMTAWAVARPVTVFVGRNPLGTKQGKPCCSRQLYYSGLPTSEWN
jgi:hypothetical protein